MSASGKDGGGAVVYVNYVSRMDAAEEVVAEIKQAGGTAFAVGFDVADSAAVQTTFDQIIAQSGGVDILVNNAGITRDGLFMRMKEDDWDAVLSTNLKGAFSCSKAVVKGMVKKKGGRIVNISSLSGVSGNAGQTNYAAAKAGLIGFSKSLAKELASRGITVNCVAPGFIDTEILHTLSPELQEKLKKEIPLGDFGCVDDVAGAVAFLVSEGGYITGETLHVNGGVHMV